MNNELNEHFMDEQEEQALLQIARNTLEAFVRTGRVPDVDEAALSPHLLERHGAFVTLRRHGELRGCIGYTSNHMPVTQAVQDNTVNAASRDPRFHSVRPEELPEIVIEISVLTPGDSPETPFKRVHDISEIVIGRDGLYIEKGYLRGGLLLPQVPVEQGWIVAQFLSAVCRKAGYADGAWRDPDAKLYRFSAQVFSENL